MRRNKRQNLGLVLTLLTSLVVGGNSWLYAIPAGRAQAEILQVNEAAAGEGRLSPAVARELLAQIQREAHGLQNDSYKKHALSAIALSYNDLSADELASDLLNQLLVGNYDDPNQVSSLFSVINGIGQLSDETSIIELLHRALAAVETVQSKENQISLLTQIGLTASRLSDRSAARDLLSQTIAMGQSDDIRQAYLLMYSATFHLAIADEATAKELLEQAFAVMDTSAAEDRSKYYTVINVLEQVLEDASDAIKTDSLALALTVINNFENQEFKSYGLAYAATIAHDSLDGATANALMAEALSIAETIPQPWAKVGALSTISDYYSRYEFNERNAGDFFKRVLMATADVQNTQYQLGALSGVVNVASNLSNRSMGQELLQQSVEIVNGFDSSVDQAEGLVMIAGGYRTLSDEVAARDLLLNMLDLLDTIEDPRLQGTTLNRFVALASIFTDLDMVHDLLQRGLEYAEAQPDVKLRVDVLRALALHHQSPVAGVGPLERLGQSLVLIEQLQEQDAKAEALFVVATTLRYLVLRTDISVDELQLQSLLSQMLAITGGLTQLNGKVFLFVPMATVIGELPEGSAQPLVEQLLSVAVVPKEQAKVLGAIASIRLGYLDEVAAQASLAEVMAIAQTMPDENDQFLAVHMVAEVASQLSNKAEAVALLDDVMAVVAGMQDSQHKIPGVTSVVTVAGRYMLDEASVQRLFGQVFEIANTLDVEDENRKAELLATMARAVIFMAGQDAEML